MPSSSPVTDPHLQPFAPVAAAAVTEPLPGQLELHGFQVTPVSDPPAAAQTFDTPKLVDSNFALGRAALLEDKGQELPRFHRVLNGLSRFRAGIDDDAGLDQDHCGNIPLMVNAALNLEDLYKTDPKARALLSPKVTTLSTLVTKLQFRNDYFNAMDAAADDAERGVIATENDIFEIIDDSKDRLGNLLQSRPGMRKSAAPLLTYLSAPAEKAKKTRRERAAAREEGRAEGRAEALAEVAKDADKSPAAATTVVVQPASPQKAPKLTAAPAARRGARGRSRQNG